MVAFIYASPWRAAAAVLGLQRNGLRNQDASDNGEDEGQVGFGMCWLGRPSDRRG
jgi:hypothetical protein